MSTAFADVVSQGVQERRLQGQVSAERDLEEEYFRREFSGEAAEWKQPQREKILQFFLRQHPKVRPVRYFGFPAAWWYFEKMLGDHFAQELRCVGVERSWQVLEYSLRHMPGGKRNFHQHPMKNGYIEHYSTRESQLVHFHAEHFFGLGRDHIGNSLQRDRFRLLFGDWTCAWIDTFSPLTGSFKDSLKHIGKHFLRSRHAFPIAVSFAIGRDMVQTPSGLDPLEVRAQVACQELNKSLFREFTLCEFFKSGREGGMQMGTVLGMMAPRPKPEQPYED